MQVWYVADEAESHIRGQYNILIAERRKIKQVFRKFYFYPRKSSPFHLSRQQSRIV